MDKIIVCLWWFDAMPAMYNVYILYLQDGMKQLQVKTMLERELFVT